MRNKQENNLQITGTAFYETVNTYNWQRRDSLAIKLFLSGNYPSFLQNFVPVTVSWNDSSMGAIHATYYVIPDYISIGTNKDWARVPLTPMAAQKIADKFDCFLPTKKMVDDIYTKALVKLNPMPMYIFRDSSITMWQHHLIIEGQRKNKKGLIAGIKKDIVISGKITRDTKPNRVAIYGWHKLDGKNIQPLYTGHVNWYVDYSHGIRLVYQKIKVNGKWMNYKEVLQHPVYHNLLCNEKDCDFFVYSY